MPTLLCCLNGTEPLLAKIPILQFIPSLKRLARYGFEQSKRIYLLIEVQYLSKILPICISSFRVKVTSIYYNHINITSVLRCIPMIKN
nr:MAG TPA: hypothetical protein [Caudoviricetes sp.]